MLFEEFNVRRNNKNLTHHALAKLSGLSLEKISKLEKSNSISRDDFNKLKNILDLDEEFEQKYVSKYNSYSEILKEKRIQLGLSVKDVAEKANVRNTYIRKLENTTSGSLNVKTYAMLKPILNLTDGEFEPFLLGNHTFKITFVNDGTFGQLVNEKRRKLKLSQSDLAEVCHVHFSLISKIENCSRTMLRNDTAMKIMRQLNFSYEEIQKYCPSFTYSKEKIEEESQMRLLEQEIQNRIKSLTTKSQLILLNEAIKVISELDEFEPKEKQKSI